MGKKSELSVEQRTQLVVRMLSKEEPSAQIARRAGIAEATLYRAGGMSSSMPGSRR